MIRMELKELVGVVKTAGIVASRERNVGKRRMRLPKTGIKTQRFVQVFESGLFPFIDGNIVSDAEQA